MQPDDVGILGRAERLDRVLAALRRRFGPWIVYRLRERRPTCAAQAIATISTGSLGLDWATAIGGLPRAALTTIHGPATSGKATLAFHTLANAQRDDGFVALLDASHSTDLAQAQRCGLDLADLLFVVPESVREAFDIAGLLVASEGLDALLISTANDLVIRPRGDLPGFQRGLRRLAVELAHAPTAAVILVQEDAIWRSRGRNAARALAHTARLRIAIAPLRPIVHLSGRTLGLRVRAAVTRNLRGPPGRTAEFEVWRDRGIHAGAELFDLGLKHALIRDRGIGRGYWYGDRWLGRGRLAAIGSLETDAGCATDLRGRLVLGSLQRTSAAAHEVRRHAGN